RGVGGGAMWSAGAAVWGDYKFTARPRAPGAPPPGTPLGIAPPPPTAYDRPAFRRIDLPARRPRSLGPVGPPPMVSRPRRWSRGDRRGLVHNFAHRPPFW